MSERHESSAPATFTQGEVAGAGTTYWLDLPYQRPPLRSNDSFLHPAHRASVVRKVREDVMLLAKSRGLKPGQHLTVQLHYAPGHNRKMDSHNLHPTVKACVDALARGKRKDWIGLELVPDDTDEYVTVLTPQIHRPPEPGPRCWLIVKVHNDVVGAARGSEGDGPRQLGETAEEEQ